MGSPTFTPQPLSDFYGDHLSPKMFGALGDAINGASCSMTSGSKTLTAAGSAFSATDIGKSIWVGGAASSGTGLLSIIAAVTSATSITLSDAATATVSGAAYVYGTDDTASFVKCFAAQVSIFVPAGLYFLQGDKLKFQADGIHLSGAGIYATTLFFPSGAGLRNYTTLDTDAPVNDVDTFFDLTIENLRIMGGVTLPDDYTVNPSTSGRSKTLTATGLNVGVRLKLGARTLLKRVAFTHLHRGLYMLGAEICSLWHCVFLQCEAGQYLTTGSQWGNAAFKVTTHVSEKAEYRACWYGIWSDALVDASVIRDDVFQLVNTALYLSNSNGVKLLSTYMEADYEGLVIDGGFAGSIICDGFDYEGPGGGGAAIHVLISCGPYVNVSLSNIATLTLGGGGLNVETGRAWIDQPQTPLTQPTVAVASVHNTGLWPDPQFSRKFVPGTNPAALPSGLSAMSWTADSEGNTVLSLTGSGGVLNYAGLLLAIYPTAFDGVLRISFEYQYSGTTPYFQPLGMVLYDGTQNLPIGPTCSPATAWTGRADAVAVPNAGLPGAPMQGNFVGTILIRKLYISSGTGLVGNYVPEPAKEWMLTAAPAWGTWRQGDTVRNAEPATPTAPAGWICTAGGSPGTWQAYGAPAATGPIPIDGTAASIYAGAGSPIGVVSAALGSVYVNTGGGSANTLWVKESGVGTNTGWVPK